MAQSPTLPLGSLGFLTCRSKANLHVASLEVTVAWMLRHNEVVASMYAGYKGGEVVVLAAAEQYRPSHELPHGLEVWHIVSMRVHDL